MIYAKRLSQPTVSRDEFYFSPTAMEGDQRLPLVDELRALAARIEHGEVYPERINIETRRDRGIVTQSITLDLVLLSENEPGRTSHERIIELP